MANDIEFGDWAFRLEPDGAMSVISHRGEEILRAVQYVVRAARSWDTVPGRATIELHRGTRTLEIVTSASHDLGGVVFRRETTVQVGPSTIGWHSHGHADAAFETNRNGFVVLHPLSLAGSDVHVEHSDGRTSQGRFPVPVSPHQPFLDVGGFRYRTYAGTEVTLEFDGDVFETEDQRNWSDASYKTYSRPLALPFPFRTERGASVRQTVSLEVRPAPSLAATIERPSPTHPGHPSVGLCLGPRDEPEHAAGVVRDLGLSHLRVDVIANQHLIRGLDRLQRAARTGVAIDLVVHIGDEPAPGLTALARAIHDDQVALAAVTLLDLAAPATTRHAWLSGREVLMPVCATVPFFAGTDDNLAELNRNPPDASWGVDGVSFGLTPQVHDRRESAILRTVEAIPAMIETSSAFAPAVAVGALSLRPRRNIYRGTPIDRLERDADAVDERQGSNFAAAWLRETLHALSSAGVSRITAFDATGPLGVLAEDGSRRPIAEVLARAVTRA